ncbi:MAG: hypothetical protein J6R67_02000 [Treponema sp.]|nr:hypothetical protein [Treponema sp.]
MNRKIVKGMIFSITVLAFCFGCTSTPAGLTESQAVGANHSPAALYSVSVSGNAKEFTSAKAREVAFNVLQVAGGFNFVDQNQVNRVYNEVKEKAAKKAKRKEVFAVLSGEEGLFHALADNNDTDEFYRSDVFKALAKDKNIKAKYFVIVNVTAGVRQTKEAVKPAAKTVVQILDTKGEVKKSITAVASVPAMILAELEDKSQVTEKFPELIERSIYLAAENLNKKDKLFEINPLKEETLEIITSSEWPVSLATWE